MAYTEQEHQRKVNLFEDITITMRNVYDSKNRDYQDSYGQSFAEEGMAAFRIRGGDKMNRIKALSLTNKQHVKNESLEDSLLDLANYCIMTLIELELKKVRQGMEEV